MKKLCIIIILALELCGCTKAAFLTGLGLGIGGAMYYNKHVKHHQSH